MRRQQVVEFAHRMASDDSGEHVAQTSLRIDAGHLAGLLARRSLSPFIGGLPTPARSRMPSAFGTLARAARSAKYFSVRRAESFEPRAV
jgi:hypothetical protein